jgi:hypothetical protein
MMEKRDRWTVVLGIAALGNLANGIWMLADPEGWYWRLPAAVPDTGPLNEHFVRDLGATFTVMAAALLAAVLRPAARVPLVAMVALFYLLHAAIHVGDTARGLLPASHWAIDFPGVYLPALLMLAFVAALAAARPQARPENR